MTVTQRLSHWRGLVNNGGSGESPQHFGDFIHSPWVVKLEQMTERDPDAMHRGCKLGFASQTCIAIAIMALS
jgi:hypothetical protein